MRITCAANTGVPRSRFDGYGAGDQIKLISHMILNHAIDDEIEHRGAAQCTESLCCFIEFRIDEFLRQNMAS